MSNREFRLTLVLIIALFVSLFGLALLSIKETHTPVTVEQAFEVIQDIAGNAGYIISSGIVYEDGSTKTVYLVYDENDNFIGQWPEETRGQPLG